MTRNSEGSNPRAANVNPTVHPAALPADTLLRDCGLRRQRRTGPGGQHRNKVETAVIITHNPTGIRGEASERRSQEENRRRALFRLRMNLALGFRSPPQDQPVASELWKGRCHAGQLSVNSEHVDFPALLAEALDVMAVNHWEAKPSAELFGCSSSQLIKFLQREPRAILLVNDSRRANGKAIYR